MSESAKMSPEAAINLWWITCRHDEEGRLKLLELVGEIVQAAQDAVRRVSPDADLLRELRDALTLARDMLKMLLSFPVAMKAIGPITKDRAEGAVFVAEKLLARVDAYLAGREPQKEET